MDAFGIDLSPTMIAIARRDHPAARFEVGTMTGLLREAGFTIDSEVLLRPDDEVPGALVLARKAPLNRARHGTLWADGPPRRFRRSIWSTVLMRHHSPQHPSPPPHPSDGPRDAEGLSSGVGPGPRVGHSAA
ncbi:hypothetical protein GCM10009625_30780 [Brachybacterium fresconis]